MSVEGAPLAFSLEEYGRRFQLTQSAVAGRDLDALLSTSLGNICWLTGFQTLASYGFALYAALIEPGREPTLVSSDFESHNAGLDCWVTDVVVYPVMADPTIAIAELLRARGLQAARIGIETGYGALTIDHMNRLRAHLPDVRWIDVSGSVEGLRAIKSADELVVMREAGRIASAGMTAALDAVALGATDNDVAAAASAAVIRGGGL